MAKIYVLEAELRALQQALATERRKRMPNIGTLQGLERKVARLQQRIEKEKGKRTERRLQKTRKALARINETEEQRDARLAERRARNRRKQEALLNDPERYAAKLERRAQRDARKAARIRAALAAGQPVGLPTQNRARRQRLREEQFGLSEGYREFILHQPCARCGRYDPTRGSQPAHVARTRGAGGKKFHILPLCGGCHDWQEENRLAFNKEYEEKNGLTPEEAAFALYEAFRLEQEEG